MLLTPLTRPLFLLTPLREGRPCGLRRLFVLRLDFYSRPCGRGDVPGTGEVLPALYFYSRPCGRGDPAGTPDAPQLGRLFLLTPLREGRPCDSARRYCPCCYFYSRPCGRGDVLWAHHWLLHWLFLLTPLREGRRVCEKGRCKRQAISTHAPAGGATWRVVLQLIYGIISTHAPAGGATCGLLLRRSRPCISTHAPAGGATRKRTVRSALREISTHAPAGGATCTPQSFLGAMIFLLTPLREGRHIPPVCEY